MLFAQVITNGVLLGGFYACMAIGFSVIWGVMNLINLAHGSMIIIGAYITWSISTATGIDPFLTIPVAGAALYAFGYGLQKVLINRLVHASVFMTLIFTFGLEMILINANIALFTADPRSVQVAYGAIGLELGSIRIPLIRVMVFAIGLLLTAGLYLFMNRTRVGNAIQATSFDKEAAQLVGVDTARIYAVTFGIGACMAGMAGSLVAVLYSFTPVVGGTLTMKSFVIVVLGGLGSIPGAIVGGIALGVAESLAVVVLPGGYKDAVGFVVLILVLVFRPQGLLGKQFFAEVKG